VAPFLFDSAYELLTFMFGDRKKAVTTLAHLFDEPGGHFSHAFAKVLSVDGVTTGVELGYDLETLTAQELRGTLNTFKTTPISRWPHLVFRVAPALSGYVPPPSLDAYYINNIAIDQNARGNGLGKMLLNHVVEQARVDGHAAIELDVTATNKGAIRFYERNDFVAGALSSAGKAGEKHGLPPLLRMRRSG